jgi:hypothetical protein
VNPPALWEVYQVIRDEGFDVAASDHAAIFIDVNLSAARTGGQALRCLRSREDAVSGMTSANRDGVFLSATPQSA